MPFLGLYTDLFPAKDRQYLRDKALDPSRPIGSVVRGLAQWPAVFATYLTIHIVENYGTSGDARVYPFIREALGLTQRDLNPAERERLWSAYRSACVILGLTVLPKQTTDRDMVGEYLHQAGVPTSFVDRLVSQFVAISEELGCPDSEDNEALQVWHEQLKPRIRYLQKPVQHAIDTDDGVYYARLFLRVLPLQTQEECQTDVERSVFSAIRKTIGFGTKIQKASIVPEVQFRDGELGVMLPANAAGQWTVRFVEHDDTSESLVSSHSVPEAMFLPCPARLPKAVEVSDRRVSFSLPIWQSAGDNQLLIFNSAGRLISKGHLGGTSLTVNPGTYGLLVRWKASELGDAAFPISENPLLYEATVTISAGETKQLRRGPTSIDICGRTVPSLEWLSRPYVGLTGRAIYASETLAVSLSIPEDIAEAAILGHELLISSSGAPAAVIPIDRVSAVSSHISLGSTLSTLSPGLARISIRLRRVDIPNRSLATVSGLVWIGLQDAGVGYFRVTTTAAFGNLDQRSSENIQIDGTRLACSDREQRFFRLIFNLSSQDALAFTWPVPGTFLVLEETKGGASVEHPIPKGDVLLVRAGSRQKLKIYSSDGGTLTLGDMRRDIRSAMLGGAQLYLSGLVEFLSPEHQTLRLRSFSTGLEDDLVRLITPHQAIKFESNRVADTYKIRFTVFGQLTRVQIHGQEIMTGTIVDITVTADEISVSGNPFTNASLATLRDDGKTEAELCFHIPDWDPGAWALSLQLQLDSRWGQLVNARGDIFAGSMQIGGDAYRTGAIIHAATIEQRLDIFQRLVEWTLDCYALESWRDLSWMDDAWDQAAEALAPDAPRQVHRLLGLAFKTVPDTASASWVPLKSVTARLLLLFALPLEHYRGLSAGRNVTRALLGMTDQLASDDRLLFTEHFFDSVLLFGFRNGAQIARGKLISLGDFSVVRFMEVACTAPTSERARIVSNMEWAPAPGDYLGVRHYWWAIERLTEKLESAQAGNDQRKGNALRLASRVANVKAPGIHPSLAAGHLAQATSLGLMQQRASDDEVDQVTENIADTVDLISVIAYVLRLETRRSGSLHESLQNMAKLISTSPKHLESIIGFVLYVGLDLFIFYLALWELVLNRDTERAP